MHEGRGGFSDWSRATMASARRTACIRFSECLRATRAWLAAPKIWQNNVSTAAMIPLEGRCNHSVHGGEHACDRDHGTITAPLRRRASSDSTTATSRPGDAMNGVSGIWFWRWPFPKPSTRQAQDVNNSQEANTPCTVSMNAHTSNGF